jgi:hypothetical protein
MSRIFGGYGVFSADNEDIYLEQWELIIKIENTKASGWNGYAFINNKIPVIKYTGKKGIIKLYLDNSEKIYIGKAFITKINRDPSSSILFFQGIHEIKLIENE